VRQFVDEMVARHDLDAAELAGILSKAKVQKKILDAIRKPAEAKPWHEYRTIFVTSPRIQEGVEFWNNTQDWLAKAEDQFGVPAEIIVGILGVETYYGARQGKFKVLDALVTLAFDYPERAEFFRGELEHFLLLVREEKIDPLTLTGSYAGAIGKPQFIPSSYRRFAVDFDGDGRKDLVNSVPDAIGSVANYFRNHHWREGQPVIAAATVEGDAYRGLLEQGLKPQTNLMNFSGYGVSIAGEALAGTDLGALVELETPNGREYWVGLQNFYVITRYNRSPLYAMAVYQLAQEVRAQRDVSVANN
jgi:membrane-bound lytic murein transglycosylase B